MISGYGSTSGFSMYLQDRAGGELTDFYQIFQQFIGALNQRPEIERAYSSFNINFPQYMVHIDPAKANAQASRPRRSSRRSPDTMAASTLRTSTASRRCTT